MWKKNILIGRVDLKKTHTHTHTSKEQNVSWKCERGNWILLLSQANKISTTSLQIFFLLLESKILSKKKKKEAPTKHEKNPKSNCLFLKIINKSCFNYILGKANRSLPPSNSNYSAVQIGLVFAKKEKWKKETARLFCRRSRFLWRTCQWNALNASRMDYSCITNGWIQKVFVKAATTILLYWQQKLKISILSI